MKATVYYCKTQTEATDRSQLFYIATNAATGIKRDTAQKQIKVTGRNNRLLAIFQF